VMNNPVIWKVKPLWNVAILASLPLGVEACARAVRGHWGFENKFQWGFGRVLRRRPEPGTRRLCRRKPGHPAPIGLKPIVTG